MTKSTGHPGEMVGWDEICCQRGHEHHIRKVVTVDLGREHGYHDYPHVPPHFACRFPMAIWQWDDEDYADMGLYCPAHDAVSRTIDELGIWEPCETIVTLAALVHSDPDSIFVDFGAQVGWFCMLAMAARRDIVAFEADPECVSIIKQNMLLNDWDDHVSYINERITADSPGRIRFRPRIALAKIDIEGAEEHAVEVLWPMIEQGMVDHLLIEISPVFNDSYPALVVRLLEAGYEAWLMPDKRTPPAPFAHFPADLHWNCLWPSSRSLTQIEELVAGWHQCNVLFSRPGAWE